MSEFFRYARDKLAGSDHLKNDHFKKLSSKYLGNGDHKNTTDDTGEDPKDVAASEIPQNTNVQAEPKR